MSESKPNLFQIIWGLIQKELKWSQSEFARQMGMTPSAVNFLVSGRTKRPASGTVTALKFVLEKAAPGLYERALEIEKRSQIKPLTSPVVYPSSSEALIVRDALWDEIQQLGPEGRREVESFVRYVANKPKLTPGLLDIEAKKKLVETAGKKALAELQHKTKPK